MNRRDFLQTTATVASTVLLKPAGAVTQIFKSAASALPATQPALVEIFRKAFRTRQRTNNLWIMYFPKTDEEFHNNLYKLGQDAFKKVQAYADLVKVFREDTKAKKFYEDVLHAYKNIEEQHAKKINGYLIDPLKRFIKDPASIKKLMDRYGYDDRFLLTEEQARSALKQAETKIRDWQQDKQIKQHDYFYCQIEGYEYLINFYELVPQRNWAFLLKSTIAEIQYAKLLHEFNEHFDLDHYDVLFLRDRYWASFAIQQDSHSCGHGPCLTDDPAEMVQKIVESIKGLLNHNKCLALNDQYYMHDSTPEEIQEFVDSVTQFWDSAHDKVKKWLPGLINRFFPQVWQELSKGDHPKLREDLKDRAGIIHDKQVANIDYDQYCNYAWTQIHKGNDYY